MGLVGRAWLGAYRDFIRHAGCAKGGARICGVGSRIRSVLYGNRKCFLTPCIEWHKLYYVNTSRRCLTSFTAADQANALRAKYPALNIDTKPSMTVCEYLERFLDIPAGIRMTESEDIVLCGRIVAKPRFSGKKLSFYQLRSGGASVQIINDHNYQTKEGSALLLKDLKEGDVVSVRGFPGKTKIGEISLVSRETTVLTPCLKDIPSGRGDGKFALVDKGYRYRHRHVDMLVHGDRVTDVFRKRAKTISLLRRFFEERNFLEVETPILSASAGGALARPFWTRENVDETDLALRIAPELYLKTLVVGGIDRVFEIGKVFRNEGISPKHNPEFTTCEFYAAYCDYEDLMDLTEKLLVHLVDTVVGKSELPNGIPITTPFKRISVIEELSRIHGIEDGCFPNVNDHEMVEDVRDGLLRLFPKRLARSHLESVGPPSVASNCKLLDKLIEIYIEPQCISPTFVCDHPIAMNPLAKAYDVGHPKQGLSQRFELFIAGIEVANAYSELNDPAEQLMRFKQQQIGDSRSDLDIMPVDESFCNALLYGLPPTAGWGLGIDRMVMLLTGSSSIRDVVFFPLMTSKSSDTVR